DLAGGEICEIEHIEPKVNDSKVKESKVDCRTYFKFERPVNLEDSVAGLSKRPMATVEQQA
ncbi:MAG: hypothetical protein AAFR99_23460, partial [Cyanobacteria bacterium J06629_9]